MSYAEIGELTFPQIRCILYRGRPPVVRLTDPAEIQEWMERVRRGD